MEFLVLVFLKLSALEKDCSLVNLPDRSLSDIARLLQTIKCKLYLTVVSNTKKTFVPTFQKPPPFQSSFCCVESV